MELDTLRFMVKMWLVGALFMAVLMAIPGAPLLTSPRADETDYLLVFGGYGAVMGFLGTIFIIIYLCQVTKNGYHSARKGIKTWAARCKEDARTGYNPFRGDLSETRNLSDADIERIADAIMKRKADEGKG